MQSGMSRLEAVLRAREAGADAELFFARVTQEGALDDGCGIVVPKGDYLALDSARYTPAGDPALVAGAEVLAAWADGRAVVLGCVT